MIGVTEAGDVGIPEIAISRFPVATADECHVVVQKVIDYLSAHPVVFVRDEGDDFSGASEELALLLSSQAKSTRLDLGPLPLADLRSQVIGTEWREAGIIHYAGHGSRTSWSAAQILRVVDTPSLPRDRTPPLVTAMNCLNGFFPLPGSPSLGEALLLEPAGGAIAYWGPSSVTSLLGQRELVQAFFDHLFAGRALSIGEAARRAIEEIAADDPAADVIRTWILLGDPTVPLR